MTLSNARNSSSMDDWDFCRDSLYEVSRTFSQPIQFLPEEQERALCIGYLLCRVADTIEDSTDIELARRDALYTLFLEVIRGEADSGLLWERFSGIEAKESELRLMEGLPRVMRVFNTQKASVCASTVRWVSEMTDGMRLYSRRSDGREFNAVYSMADLERYCYFVAGTVGHLITELFDEAVGKPGLEALLREECESFGLGLQMVNIVKDVTDDFSRGVCYLPRQMCRAEGFEPEALLEPDNKEAALRVVNRVAERASEHLEAALRYTLTIPPEHTQLRLFCLLPLWMAVQTLALARDNEAVLIPGQPVKINREAVGRIIADCGAHCRDDAALRAQFEAMSGSAVHGEPSNSAPCVVAAT